MSHSADYMIVVCLNYIFLRDSVIPYSLTHMVTQWCLQNHGNVASLQHSADVVVLCLYHVCTKYSWPCPQSWVEFVGLSGWSDVAPDEL